eukprot:3971407-Amphidinium_carterae.1
MTSVGIGKRVTAVGCVQSGLAKFPSCQAPHTWLSKLKPLLIEFRAATPKPSLSKQSPQQFSELGT